MLKLIFNEIRRDKIASLWLMIWLVISNVYTIINTRFILIVTNALTDFDNIENHLVTIIVISMIQIVNFGIINFAKPMFTHQLLTSINNNFCDKIINSDTQMFVKYSCAYINTAGERINKITLVPILLVRITSNVITLIITFATIYQVGGKLVIPILMIYGIGIILLKPMFNKYNIIDTEMDIIKHKRNQVLENAINGFAEIRLFNRTNEYGNRIHSLNKSIKSKIINRSKVQVITNMILMSVDSLGTIFVILYSVYQIKLGNLDQAQAMSLVLLIWRIIDPLVDITANMDKLSSSLSDSGAYKNIMEYENIIEDGSITLSEFNNSLSIENVSFSYNDSSNIIRNIDISIKKGEHIGICGESGGGKSTIFKMLNKFYKPSDGILK